MTEMPELSSMKCFIAVAEELHFGRAAKRLNMTQPTLSHRIRKLEDSFGVQLFIRSTRSVELTPPGETFLPLARDMLVNLDEAVLLSKLAAGGMSPGGEHLKVGAIDPAAHRLLPLILRRFRNRFPETRLDVRIYDSSELLRALERGDCHVGIMRPPSNVNLVRFRPLVADRFMAVIPRQSPLAARTSLRLSDFVGHKVFTLKRFELSSFEEVHNQITAAGIDTDIGVNVSNTTAALALATAGLGITFLPEWIESVVSSAVVLRPVEELTQEISMGIGWRADNPVPGILPFVEYADRVSRAR
ncbi:LysR family transcriptional regulator [Chelativorans xinjiangense]|uniref:LysR substrate-binding domain-containing protein n=1 Tax=Chelativorans xinjiangense TaxID=2681485 RepID=UPI00135C211F|nr:LysR family transcriptional regulator [Chelativorans xinjiangense]